MDATYREVRAMILRSALILLLSFVCNLHIDHVADETGAAILYAAELKRAVTYFGYTEEYHTISWDIVQDDPATPEVEQTAEWYEVELFHIEQQVAIARGRVDHPGNLAAITYPRSGHYEHRVRACVQGATEPLCSEWSTSLNAAVSTVDGQPEAWWVYKHVSPPSEPGVE